MTLLANGDGGFHIIICQIFKYLSPPAKAGPSDLISLLPLIGIKELVLDAAGLVFAAVGAGAGASPSELNNPFSPPDTVAGIPPIAPVTVAGNPPIVSVTPFKPPVKAVGIPLNNAKGFGVSPVNPS